MMNNQLQLAFRNDKNSVEFKKHSAIIQISNIISLVQRKSFNAMLMVAREQCINDPQREMFCITFSRLRQISGVAINDYRHIATSLKQLMETIVEYNLLNKDSSYDWGAFVLLSEVRIASGQIFYSLPPSLRSALINPRLYAKLNIEITRALNSKYSLAMYELSKDYINVSIPKMDMATFRKVMGIENDKYLDMKDLKKRVIEPAIKELNEKTDIQISYELLKERAKNIGIQFFVKEKEILNDSIDAGQVDVNLACVEKILPDSLKLNSKLMNKITEYLKSHGLSYVQSNIEYTLQNAKINPEAYLLSALLEDYAIGFRADQMVKQMMANKRKDIEKAAEQKKAEDEINFSDLKNRYWTYFKSLAEEDQNFILKDIKSKCWIFGPDEKTKVHNYLTAVKKVSLSE